MAHIDSNNVLLYIYIISGGKSILSLKNRFSFIGKRFFYEYNYELTLTVLFIYLFTFVFHVMDNAFSFNINVRQNFI